MSRHPVIRAFLRKNTLAGLMFIAIAALGLWLSRNYPIGTATRMSTGYMPRLLCWLLMGLGAIVVLQGLLERGAPPASEEQAAAEAESAPQSWWPVLVVAASLVAFALSIETLGLIAAVTLLVLIASLAYRGLGWMETLATAAVLAALCWTVFILGLGMPMRVWPEL